jgi:DNA-binding PadR family transcriptional regulator
VDNRLRRYYRLTPKGAQRLAAEAARLQDNAAAALSRLYLLLLLGAMFYPYAMQLAYPPAVAATI